MIVKEYKSLAEGLIEEGMEKGNKERQALERFHSLLLFLKGFPDWGNQQIAKYARLNVEKVIAFKAILQNEKDAQKIIPAIKKLFFKDIEVSKGCDLEISQALKDFLKERNLPFYFSRKQ